MTAVKVVTTGKTRYGEAEMEPDEKCSCYHGGPDAEDHTSGNGCERRGCTCRFWPAEDKES